MRIILFFLMLLLVACEGIFKLPELPKKELFSFESEVRAGEIILLYPTDIKDFKKSIYEGNFGNMPTKIKKVADSVWICVVPDLAAGKHSLTVKVDDKISYEAQFTILESPKIANPDEYLRDFAKQASYLPTADLLLDTLAARFVVEKITETYIFSQLRDSLNIAINRSEAANNKNRIVQILAANRKKLDNINKILQELVPQSLRLYQKSFGFLGCDAAQGWQRPQCLYAQYVNAMAALAEQKLLYSAALGLEDEIAPLYLFNLMLKNQIASLRLTGLALNYWGFIYEPSQSKLILDKKVEENIQNRKAYSLQLRAAYRCIRAEDSKLGIDWLRIVIQNTQLYNQLLDKTKLELFKVRMLENETLVNNFEIADMKNYNLRNNPNSKVSLAVRQTSFAEQQILFSADCEPSINFDYWLDYDDQLIKNSSLKNAILFTSKDLKISELNFRVICNNCTFKNNANYGTIRVTLKLEACTDQQGFFEMLNILDGQRVITQTPMSKVQISGDFASFDIEYYNGTNQQTSSLVAAELRYKDGRGGESLQLLLNIPR